MGDELKIAVQAPPEKGKANKALLKFLAKQIAVTAIELKIVSGQTSEHKQIAIPLTLEELKLRLQV